MLMARLIAVKVLPSRGSELVTMTRFRFRFAGCEVERAFLMIGRFITRNSSAIWDFGSSGVMKPFFLRRSRSMSRNRIAPLRGAGPDAACALTGAAVAAGAMTGAAPSAGTMTGAGAANPAGRVPSA